MQLPGANYLLSQTYPMKNFVLLIFLSLSACGALAQEKLIVAGLRQPVEVIRDKYGINHIYAQNEHDLFFAQGYCAARDRLFQFEIWRRQATGTVAEIMGPDEVMRDVGTRLFRFRGDLDKELNHYHENGKAIITAFTAGVNAMVAEALRDKSKLTIEFRLLGIEPGYWTPAEVISRHQGLLGNITEEIQVARQVATLGAAKVKELDVFEPGDPSLEIDPAINTKLLFDSVGRFEAPIYAYQAFRSPLRFTPKNLLSSRNDYRQYQDLATFDDAMLREVEDLRLIGSNNWIVSGTKSASGSPILANDPHRALSAPSLRYMVHLNAPGWNVVGGGEPTIPGVSIGHNDHGAWGLTVFAVDGEDLYVYELNPANHNQYRYAGEWESMKVIEDTIRVKGGRDHYVKHRYTRHGPVTYVDSANHVAYAIRCGWMDIGGSPYLASLRIDQATNWEEFREACGYSHIPGENMIWADKQGNIGWQAVGWAPIRPNWSGLVPVPGDGRYEWKGFMAIRDMPHIHNPKKGFWATANENLVPKDYQYADQMGKSWADTYRADRINEVLASKPKHSFEEMLKLQFDYLSIPARELVPLLKSVQTSGAAAESARQKLLKWNYVLNASSVEAGIYVAWEKRLQQQMLQLKVPANARKFYTSVPLSRTIAWLKKPGAEFGANPKAGRDKFLGDALQYAVDMLEKKLGQDQSKWQYGQASYHHVLIRHPLSNAVNADTRKQLDVGPLPRGGYGSTPGMTGNSDNQTAGASFRMVADVSDWDKTMFTNSPGQSGNTMSPWYKDLFALWANDQHFPVYFTKEKIVQNAGEKVLLVPN